MREEFKVTQGCPTEFYISIGVGKRFFAKNLEEVTVALEHYFLSGDYTLHPPSRGSTAANKCPLCRG